MVREILLSEDWLFIGSTGREEDHGLREYELGDRK